MARRRIGVVLLLPEPARTEVRALRRALGSASVDTQPPHITLVRPVNVREAELGDALGIVRAAAASTPPLRLRLGPAETFSPVSPVVHLGVHGDDVERVRALAHALDRGALARPVTHAFVPHCTLHESVEAHRVDEIVRAVSSYRVVCDIDRVDVLEHEDDHVWRTLADMALGAPAVRGRGGIEVVMTVGEMLPPDAADLVRHASHGTVAGARPWSIDARAPTGDLIGAAMGSTIGGTIHVAAIVIAAAHRRCGVGDRLLEEAIQLGRARTCEQAVIDATGDDVVDQWYARRGFVVGPAGPPGPGERLRRPIA